MYKLVLVFFSFTVLFTYLLTYFSTGKKRRNLFVIVTLTFKDLEDFARTKCQPLHFFS